MGNFPHLFSPIKIGGLAIPNRISLPPMHLNYSENGFVTDRYIEFYRVRARGGAGLIIIGGCAIDTVGGNPLMIKLDDDKYIPELKRLTAAIRSEGARSAAQLYHSGRYNFSAVIGGLQPIAPSPVSSKMFGGETPREMTREDIENVKQAFVRAALRAREAGFDAVEIHGSAGYLLCQFLSPVTNLRKDEYGGRLENRVRFPREVVEVIRQGLGPDYPVIIRITGADLVPGGLTNQDMQKVCKVYEQAGANAIDITGGWHESRVPQITMNVPRGAFVYLARGIKEKLNIPVIASNRINNPELAESLILRGEVDMVNMGRPLIADPDLPRKAKSGQARKIRPCVACNQGCLDMVFEVAPVTCLVNHRAGKELEFPESLPKAGSSRKILVIGGGAAGMEAAAIAAERGHEVVIWEKRNRLGGQLELCAAPPGRQEFNHLLPYYQDRLKKAKVKIELNREGTISEVKSLSPEVVIVATGSSPVTPPFSGAEKKNVYLAHQILRGEVWPPGRVVIIGGGATGCETAHFLASADTINAEVLRFLFVHQAESNEELYQLATRAQRPITVLEMLPRMGQDLGRSMRWTVLDDLRRAGVELKTGTRVKEITDSGVIAEKDGTEEVFTADSVIIAAGVRPNGQIYQELEASGGFELYRIGDARSPRKLIDAITEGFETGMKI
ncbi:MAG: FAD-dependent oxidoreductase [Deltaproteobacteria bacterium]|nr:MAG: FAD-dependent oxidoreductase [Deltaproteobacteria bacterium]